MSETLTAKQAAEQLLYQPEYAADKNADVKAKAAAFAEGYKTFLNAAKTEREAAAASEKLLVEAGYEKFEPKKVYAPGQKIYFIQEHKAVVAATIGQKPFEEGFRLVIAHIDSPRLDLRPNPLYESNHFSYFKTHYYGGIRKYQWGTIPLAIHGVFTRADGSSVSFAVGEDENDPVFCITDLLPHLGAEQNDRKLSEGIKAEELNVLIGSDAVEDADIKEAVKLNTLMLLHEKYGVTDFHSVYDFILNLKEIAKAGVVGIGPGRCHSIGELTPRKISANRHSLLESIVEVFTAKTCIVLHNELYVVDRVIELPVFVACELAYPIIVFIGVVKTVLEALEVCLCKLFANLRNLQSLILQFHKRGHFVRRRTRTCVVVQIAVEVNTDEIEGVTELSACRVRAVMGIRKNTIVVEN